jgi:hypothetical protein
LLFSRLSVASGPISLETSALNVLPNHKRDARESEQRETKSHDV